MPFLGRLSITVIEIIINNILVVFATCCAIYAVWKKLRKWETMKLKMKQSHLQHINKYDAEIIIIGSGVLGSVMAAVLGRQKYKVIVIEKDFKQPCRIVGELLQPGGVEALQKLGLESALEGIDAQTSFGYIIHHNEMGTSIKLPYESATSLDTKQLTPNATNSCCSVKYNNSSWRSWLKKSSNNAMPKSPKLPNGGDYKRSFTCGVVGKAFHHGRFVQNLRRAYENFANVIKIEGEAIQFLWFQQDQLGCPGGGLTNKKRRVYGVQYRDKLTGQIKQVTAPLTLVVDGCFSKFRNQLFPPIDGKFKPQVKSHFLGLLIANPTEKTHKQDYQFKSSKEENMENINNTDNKYYAEVILANDPASVVLVYKISSRYTRILIDIPNLPKDLNEFLRYDITPQLPEKYQANFLDALENNVKRRKKNYSNPFTNSDNDDDDNDGETNNFSQIEKQSNENSILFDDSDLTPQAFHMKVMPNSYLTCPPTGPRNFLHSTSRKNGSYLGGGGLPSGVLALGDALNMRHPLTGGGMTVALNDAIFWLDRLETTFCQNIKTRTNHTKEKTLNEEVFKQCGDTSNYKLNNEEMHEYDLKHKKQVHPLSSEIATILADDEWLNEGRHKFSCERTLNYSFAVNVLAQALYQLYASGTDYHLKEMRKACFHYFGMGGMCLSGPMGILSITNPKPHVLLGHFFGVAVYTIYRVIFQSKIGFFKGISFSCTLLYKACNIIFPLIRNEWNAISLRSLWYMPRMASVVSTNFD